MIFLEQGPAAKDIREGSSSQQKNVAQLGFRPLRQEGRLPRPTQGIDAAGWGLVHGGGIDAWRGGEGSTILLLPRSLS